MNDRQRQQGSLAAAEAQLEGLAGKGQSTSDGGWTTPIDGARGLENRDRVGDATGWPIRWRKVRIGSL